jgi:hypothetical protein
LHETAKEHHLYHMINWQTEVWPHT